MRNLLLAVCLLISASAMANTTTFNSDGSTSNTVSNGANGATTFNSNSSTSSTVYDGRGGATTFNSDGSISSAVPSY